MESQKHMTNDRNTVRSFGKFFLLFFCQLIIAAFMQNAFNCQFSYSWLFENAICQSYHFLNSLMIRAQSLWGKSHIPVVVQIK